VEAVGEFASVAAAPLPMVLPDVLPVGLPEPALRDDEEELGELDVVEFDRLLPEVVSLPVEGVLLLMLLPDDGLLELEPVLPLVPLVPVLLVVLEFTLGGSSTWRGRRGRRRYRCTAR